MNSPVISCQSVLAKYQNSTCVIFVNFNKTEEQKYKCLLLQQSPRYHLHLHLLYLSVCLSVCLSLCLSVCLSVCLSGGSIYYLSIYLSGVLRWANISLAHVSCYPLFFSALLLLHTLGSRRHFIQRGSSQITAIKHGQIFDGSDPGAYSHLAVVEHSLPRTVAQRSPRFAQYWRKYISYKHLNRLLITDDRQNLIVEQIFEVLSSISRGG